MIPRSREVTGPASTTPDHHERLVNLGVGDRRAVRINIDPAEQTSVTIQVQARHVKVNRTFYDDVLTPLWLPDNLRSNCQFRHAQGRQIQTLPPFRLHSPENAKNFGREERTTLHLVVNFVVQQGLQLRLFIAAPNLSVDSDIADVRRGVYMLSVGYLAMVTLCMLFMSAEITLLIQHCVKIFNWF